MLYVNIGTSSDSVLCGLLETKWKTKNPTLSEQLQMLYVLSIIRTIKLHYCLGWALRYWFRYVLKPMIKCLPIFNLNVRYFGSIFLPTAQLYYTFQQHIQTSNLKFNKYYTAQWATVCYEYLLMVAVSFIGGETRVSHKNYRPEDRYWQILSHNSASITPRQFQLLYDHGHNDCPKETKIIKST